MTIEFLVRGLIIGLIASITLGPVGVLTTSIFDLGNAIICFGGSFSIAQAVKEVAARPVER